MGGETGNARRFSRSTRAIVVGIGKYQGSELEDLPECPKEAAAVARALASPNCCGIPEERIQLVLESEASADTILATVDEAAQAATSDEILIVYFAGHGQNEGGGFLLRTGPRERDPKRGISRDELAAKLAHTRARGVLVILDCCGGAGFAERAPDFFYGLADHDFRLLVSASRAGQSSWELKDRGSLFTKRLLRALNGVDAVGDGGSIFFSDLFDYLYNGVVADARAAFGGEQEQTPVFAGSHAADPLLFLNRDLTLSQVRVRTARITPDVLRRRVAGALGGPIAAVLLLAAGYWAFVDSHQYLEVRGDNIVLVRGYPGLTGFGFPKDEWTYNEGPGRLQSSEALGDGRRYAFDRQISPEAKLRNLLVPAARARIDIWSGDRQAAREELLDAVSRRELHEDNDLEFLPDIVVAADKPVVEKIVSGLQSADSVSPVLALKKLDPNAAIAAFGRSPAAANVGMQFSVLSAWDGACTPATQTWLRSLLSGPNVEQFYALVARTFAKTAGCVFDLTTALEAPRPAIRDAVFALRMTNAEGAAKLREVLAQMLEAKDAAVRGSPQHFSRLAAFWRYLDVGACADWLFEMGDALDEDARLDAMVAAARDCSGYELVAEPSEGSIKLDLRSAKGNPASVSATADGAGVFPIALATLDAPVSNKGQALLSELPLIGDSQARTTIVQKLRRLGAKPDKPFEYGMPDAPELDREIVWWIAQSDPKTASKMATDRIVGGERNSAFLGVLALLSLDEADRDRLLRAAATMDATPSTIVTAMVAAPDVAAGLVVSPDPRVRALAADYVLGRADAAAVIAAARKRSAHADVVIDRSEAQLARMAKLGAQLSATPDFALAWRVGWLQQTEINSDGQSLALERLLNGERQSALALP
jgi:hypothetical protein